MATVKRERSAAEPPLLQEFWHDLASCVLHDSVFRFTYGWDYARAEQTDSKEILFTPGQDYFDKVQKLRDDHMLIRYIAHSTENVPLSPWRSRELCDSLTHSHNEHKSWGYTVRFIDPCEDRPVRCPAFLVSAILAAMYFRIPSGNRDRPQTLALSCCLSPLSPVPQGVRFSVETPEPLSSEVLRRVQISDHGDMWDRWHHSWDFASDWASRYGGRCHAETVAGDRLRVTLDLPTD